MNGFYSSHAPSLNGLAKSDGTTQVSSVQQLTGDVNHTTSSSSFFYETQGQSVVLQVPFTTVGDTLQTALKFQPNELQTSKVTTDRLVVNGSEFNPGTGGTNPTWSQWSFSPQGDNLNLMHGNRAYYRFLGDPINIFSRVSLFEMTQNGKWSIRKDV
jgi:hypothetical protein